MSNENLRTQIEDSLRQGMKSFIGSSNTESTRGQIRESVKRLLYSFQYHYSRSDLPLPEVVVDVDMNQAHVYVIDPKTKEKIEIGTWATRVADGYYE